MRKLVVVLLVMGVVGALALAGRRGYRHWTVGRSVSSAREAIARGEMGTAAIWLRRALQLDGNRVEAVRLMGDLAEGAFSPDVLYWRKRLLELEPAEANRYALARAAILHRDFTVARGAMEGLSAAEQSSAEYCRLAGTMALVSGQMAEAEAQFREVLRQQPDHLGARMNLAMIRLQHVDPAVAAEARRDMEALRNIPELRLDALRHLTHDGLQRSNLTRAVALARELAAHTNAVWMDRMLELEVLSLGKPSEVPATLARLQRDAGHRPADVYEVAKWMLKGAGPARCLEWLETLDGAVRTNVPVTMVLADAYLATANWTGLQAWVRSQAWGDLDFLRFAFSARALREQGLDQAAKADWAKALQQTGGRVERLRALGQVVEVWGWGQELEEILWKQVEGFPNEKGAVATLADLLQARGQTRSLLTLFALELKRDPKNPAVKNNLAAVALLLNATEVDPHRLAREAYEAAKADPAAVATYAFSLYLAKRAPEALPLLRQLPPDALREPSVAGYYGLVLAAVGETDAARLQLNVALRGRLLPEETKLFERARP